VLVRESLTRDKRDRYGWAFFIASLAISAFYLIPILHSGLADEDLLLAHISAIAAVDHISPWLALQEVVGRISKVEGGFSPLRCIPLALWLLTGSVAATKALQFSMILCNVATFGLFARRLLRSDGGALLATALTLCAWQLRYPHDPTMGSSFLWPWTLELVLISLYAIVRFSDQGGTGWSIVATLAATGAGLSNFAILPVVALMPIFSIAVSTQPRRLGITIALIFAALITGLLQLKYINDSIATLNGFNYLRTVVIQMVAALPASYRAMGNVAHDFPLDSFSDTRFQDIPDVMAIGWLAIVGTTLASFVGYTFATFSRQYRSALAIVPGGLILWLGPSLAFGPTVYWHSGVPNGQSYGSIYIEQFGVGLLFAWVALAIGRWRVVQRSSVGIGLSVVVFLLVFGNVRVNAFAAERLGQADYTRAIVDRSGADRFFASIPVGSKIVIPNDSNLYSPVYGGIHDSIYAIYHYTGRLYSVADQASIQPGGDLCEAIGESVCASKQKNVYILRTAKAHLTDPQLSLARWTGSRDGIEYSDVGHGFAAFPSDDAANDGATLLVSAQPGVHFDVAPKIEPSALAFTASRTCGPVPVNALYSPAIPTIAWGPGFYPATTYGELPVDAIGNPPMRGTEPLFRWAGRNAELIVTRSTCPPTAMRMTFAVVTSEPANIFARWPGAEQILRGGAHTPTAFNIELGQTLRSPIRIVLETDSQAFVEERLRIRNEGEAPQDRRMLVLQPTVGDELPSPLDPRLDPTGGLQ
jgi:hypothetical protein